MASGKCYHHPSKDAVGQCRACGKSICKDCYDDYGVSIGEYAGQALCYDCTAELVAENVTEIGIFREIVKKERTGIIIGAVIAGSIFFFAGLSGITGGDFSVIETILGFFMALIIGVLLGVGIGGSFITIAKFIWKFPMDGLLKFIILMTSLPVTLIGAGTIGTIVTVVRFIKRINQIKQCDEIIASDERALQEMRDYFAYTQVMEKKAASIDLAKLADQGGELFNNTYAQSVMKNGEKAAQEGLRKNVTQFAANGEIIRSFDKRISEKKAA